MKRARILIIFLGFLIPYIIAYRAFFVTGHLAFGDAPFFYPSNLKELFSPPLIWNFRNENFGALQSQLLWLYIPTYLYGFLNHFFSLDNDILIRIIFYFPATVFSIIGSWLFIGRFIKNTGGKFLGSFLYGFNTYFLTVIDGGQIGMSLSYGLFPSSLYFLINFIEKSTIKHYLSALLFTFLLFNTDLRIALIAILVIILLQIPLIFSRDWKIIKQILFNLMLILISIFFLSAFWSIPFLVNYKDGLNSTFTITGENNFINLINSLFLFQPHFPANEFGKINPTPFYFGFITWLVFGGLLFARNKKMLWFGLLFLLFSFLAKGGSEPFGNIYLYFVNNLPLGAAFRDSSKYFIPLLLIGGVLISHTMSLYDNHLGKKFFWVATALILLYFSFLIYPAFLGGLTGVLGKKSEDRDFVQVGKLSDKENFYRSLWFEEKLPLSYADWKHPAISANTLYQERPFASLISGQYDLFQFVRNPHVVKWWNLLGIKYIFLPNNERKKTITPDDIKNYDERLEFIDKLDLKKLSLPISFPVFEVENPKPQIFAQKKIFIVVGGEEIYQKLFENKKFNLASQGFVFMEDDKTDTKSLTQLDSNDAVLIFEHKSQQDLILSFLKDKIISPNKAYQNAWQLRENREYLKWKYDLLKNGINSFEFDHGKGMAFSTVAGEKISFRLNIPSAGNYYFAIRYLVAPKEGRLKVSIFGQDNYLAMSNSNNFKWEILGPGKMKKGQIDVQIQNTGTFSIISGVTILSDDDLNKAAQYSSELMNKFKVIQIAKDEDWHNLNIIIDGSFIPITYYQKDPTRYLISNLPPDAKWLVFSDHFSAGWVIKEKSDTVHLPFYSMINGFYVKDMKGQLNLVFAPQKTVYQGIFISVLSFGIITLILLGFVICKKKKGK